METKIKIFVVDDDPIYLLIASKSLQAIQEHEMTSFTSSEKFLKEMNESVDIVILDYNIDQLNGLDLTKIIHEKFPRTTIIGLSSQEDINVAADYIEYGAWRYIIKNKSSPRKIVDLVKEISIQILGSRQFSKEMNDLIRFKNIF